jgi:hypothetical protein
MQQDYFKSLNEFSNSAMEAARTLGEINGKLMEKTIALHMKAADLAVEGGLQQGKLVQEAREIKDFIGNQTGLVQEYAGKFVELANSNVSLAQEAGEEYKTWVEKRMDTANSAAKDVASKAVAVKSAIEKSMETSHASTKSAPKKTAASKAA